MGKSLYFAHLGREVKVVEGSQVENGKTLLYRAYVGEVFLSPELDGAVSYHGGGGMEAAIVRCAGLAIYDHRDASVTAAADFNHADLDWEAVRQAFNRPAFVQVKQKKYTGEEYLVLLPISRNDKEERLEARRPHFLLSLLSFPDGGPIAIDYNGAFWHKPYMPPQGSWDAELIAITTGFVPNGTSHPKNTPSRPRKVMIFRVNGQEGWHVLGSRVNQMHELDNELYQLIEETS